GVRRLLRPEGTELGLDAGSSIVEYERWRRERDKKVLLDIEQYNQADCESTSLLRAWLEERRAQAIGYGLDLRRPERRDPAPAPELAAAEVAVRDLTVALLAGLT